MKKFNIKEIYADRIEQIDTQIRGYVHKKQWGKVKELREERKRLDQRLKAMEEK